MALKDYIKKAKKGFGKFFGVVGNVLEKIAFTAVLATGIGFVQWARGKFPFTEVPKREYHITQWFWEKRGPALMGEGTRWYLPPLYRKVLDKDKKPVALSAETLSHESNEFTFRTSDNLDGRLRVEYLYRVTGANGANKFYWDYGKEPNRLDTIIRQPILEKIATIKGEDLTSQVYAYLKEAEKEANKRLDEEETGIQITNFAITQPVYTPESEAILKTKVAAIQEREAILIKADAQAREAEIQQAVTARTLDGYLDAGKKYSQVEVRNDTRAAHYATMFWRGDNAQQMATSGKGRVVNVMLDGLNR